MNPMVLMTAPQQAQPPIFVIEALFSVSNMALSDIFFPFVYEFFDQRDQVFDKDGRGHVFFHGVLLKAVAALRQQRMDGCQQRIYAHRRSFFDNRYQNDKEERLKVLLY